MRTVSAALRTITTWATVAFIATFSFAAFFCGCFGTASALFGSLAFFPRFGSRRSFGSWKWGGAFDADFEFGDDVGMEAEFDFVFAQDADGMFEVNFPFVEADIELSLKLIGDHAGCDGAEHFAVLTGLDRDDANELGKALGELGHGVEIVRFAFGAALLEDLKASFVCAGQGDCKALREEKVTGVTGCDFDLVGFAAKADNIVS